MNYLGSDFLNLPLIYLCDKAFISSRLSTPCRIPKRLLYGRLVSGIGSQGNHKTYRNQVRDTLRACGIEPTNLEHLAASRANWRRTYRAGIAEAEADRIDRLIDKRVRRKHRAGTDLTHQPT